MGYLEQKPFAGTGDPAVARFCFHKHNVGPDFFDAVPGDYVVVPTSGNAEEAAGAGNDDGSDIALRNIDLDIGNEAQPLAGADADDFLALQIRKLHGHGALLLLDSVYAGEGSHRTVNYRLTAQGMHCTKASLV